MELDVDPFHLKKCIYFWLCVGFLHNISQHVMITYLNLCISKKYLCFSVR
nr:MAG TPA: hypothetical protein [Caudoviricetes sp.]